MIVNVTDPDKGVQMMVEMLVDYIRSGIKTADKKSLGVEVEHFILDSESKESVPYSGKGGVRDILLELMKCYPEAEPITGEDILGFFTPDLAITLEPAAQMEISITQSEDIEYIKHIYTDFCGHISRILLSAGKELFTKGCQPVSKVDDLELIPKGRYRLMDEHFKKTGTGGRQMMRGTASTQISVDYTSEEDFRKKLQAAYFFTPLFKIVTDRVESFEGKKTGSYIFRNDIWCRTDPERCGVLPDIFKKDYGFRDYAEYICSEPLIVMPCEGTDVYTDKRAPEAYAGKELTKADIEHIFSMVFPDVRVKKYIEIRGADAMPPEGVYAYCALIKGLIYSENVLDHVQEYIENEGLCGEDIRMSEKSLAERGMEGKIYGVPAGDFLKDALDMCRENLKESDKKYLDGWEWVR